MQVSVAEAILNEVKNGGYEDQPMPEDDQAKLERAEWWVGEASKAWSNGMRTDTIKSVLTMGGALTAEAEAEAAPTIDEPEEQPVEILKSEDLPPKPEPEPEPEPTAEVYGSPSEAVKAAESVEAEGKAVKEPGQPTSPATRENLPIPAEIQGEPVEMPIELAAESDGAIRRLHGVYAAYAARVDYLTAVESQHLHHAKIVLQHEMDRARRAVPKLIDGTDKAKLSADIEAEVRDDEGVVAWQQKVDNLESSLIELKALAAIYARNIGVLSREWSMRTDEFTKTQ